MDVARRWGKEVDKRGSGEINNNTLYRGIATLAICNGKMLYNSCHHILIGCRWEGSIDKKLKRTCKGTKKWKYREEDKGQCAMHICFG